jgi:hypothetical protein
LRVTIDERSDAGGLNINESSSGDGLSMADALKMIKPEGDYYVIALAHGDPLAEDSKMHDLGRDLIRGSIERIRRDMIQPDFRNLKPAEVWVLVSRPPLIEGLLAGTDSQHDYEVPEEYRKYDRVFFLNEEALRMYRDGGVQFDVLKKVSSDQMPAGIHRTIRGPYIPNSG